jgi:tetratricopeptide (TPR) repeat protein
MFKTPKTFLFFSAVIFFLAGFALERSRALYLDSWLPEIGKSAEIRIEPKEEIERYLSLGDVDQSIAAMETFINTIPEDAQKAATIRDLGELIKYKISIRGQIINYYAQISITWPPRLYIAAGTFILLWGIYIVFRSFRPKNLFVILPFEDYSELKIGADVPVLALNRLRESVWRLDTLGGVDDFIAEEYELPTLGILNENQSLDASSILETAFSLSTGLTDVPFAKILQIIKIWLEQPKFVVKGVIDTLDDRIGLDIFLINYLTNKMEKVWHIETPVGANSRLLSIDLIIYPLLFQFSNQITTKNWQAFKNLSLGLRHFKLFHENDFDRSHLKAAQDYLEQALTSDPDYLIAQYNLALVSLASGDFNHAKELFKELALTCETEPLKTASTYNYGVALFSLSQDWAYEQAIKAFNDLLNTPTYDLEKWGSLVRATLALVYGKTTSRDTKKKNEYATQAIKMADEIIESEEDDQTKSFALTAKGFAHLGLKEYESAAQEFQRSKEINPDYLQNYLGLGEVYEALAHTKDNKVRSAQLENAYSSYRKAALISPFSGYALYKLGTIYLDLGEEQSALETLSKAPHFALAKLLLGKIYQGKGQLDKALEAFKEAANMAAKLSEAWVNIAWTILELEDQRSYKEAEQAARRALQLDGEGSWHRHAVLARCLLASGKFEKAHQEAQKAIKSKGGERAQSYLYLAQAQFELGYYAQVQETCKKGLSFKDKEDWIDGLTTLLEKTKTKS